MRWAGLFVLLVVGCASPVEDDTASNASGGASNAGGTGTIGDSGFPNSGGTSGEAGSHAAGGNAGSGTGGGATGCAHPAVNAPTADDSDLEAGPVVKFTVIVYYIKRGPNDEIITPVEQNGKWLAQVGDKIVFDSTQKNANNKPCQWESDPEYIVSDSCAFERLATGNPFLLQMQAHAPGELAVSATIDGITANEVTVLAQ